MDCDKTIERTWDSLRKLAPERFEKFRKPGDPDYSYAISRYQFDLALRESLIPMISGTEVALRNVIHSCLTASHGERWFEGDSFYFHEHEQAALDKNFGELEERRGVRSQQLPPCDIISHLSMGFWVGLLTAKYQASVWALLGNDRWIHQGVKKEHFIGREAFHIRCHNVRKLRNRLAHNEPISTKPDIIHPNRTLPVIHAEALEMIGWINKRYLITIKLTDRFEEVWSAGSEPYRIALVEELCKERPVSGVEHLQLEG
ncbi:MAG: Abi family protein [Armatimonadetes bacterium]|nr:Abi family protein [Armatimonadota bacterium]